MQFWIHKSIRWTTYICLVGGLLIGCASETPSSDGVRVENLRYRLLPGGARILTGSLVNEGKSQVDVAQIDISLFDEDNRRISSMFVVVHDVEANTSREFREAVDGKLNVHGARVRGILIP